MIPLEQAFELLATDDIEIAAQIVLNGGRSAKTVTERAKWRKLAEALEIIHEHGTVH